MTLRARKLWFGGALIAGVTIAGFWNFRVVDGFGRDVATAAMGDVQGKASQYAILGAGFGFFFAAIAGLAATFTACNCVAFAMIPGLACADSSRSSSRAALSSLGIMAFWVAVVSAVYGVFVGWLGPVGAEAFNTRQIRSAQSFTVFTSIGVMMVLWGAIELNLLRPAVARCSDVTRAFFSQPTTKAAMMGIMVGAFAVGRPYPVFREFLLYAAQTNRPTYGAAVMIVQGLSQIAVMAALFLIVLGVGRQTLLRWIRSRPQQPALVSAVALVTGGAFFVYYWGIVRIWPQLGRWGFRLGWYE